MRLPFALLSLFLWIHPASADDALRNIPLECKVVTTDEHPVEGATIFVGAVDSNRWVPGQPLITTGMSDAAGRFATSFPIPGHLDDFVARFLAVHPKLGVGIGNIYWTTQPSSDTSTTIRLLESGTLRVRILRPDGSPAAGLEVWVTSLGLRVKEGGRFTAGHGEMIKLPGNLWKATTDSEGRCIIDRLPKNAIIYLTHGDHRFAQLPGMNDPWRADGPVVKDTEHTLKLSTPGRIIGRAVLGDGRPAAGSLISILERMPYEESAYGCTVKAGDDGRFVIEQIPPASYHVSYDSQPPFFKEWIGEWKHDEDGTIQVPADRTTDLGDLTLKHAATIIGEVVDAKTGAKVDEPITFRVPPGDAKVSYRSLRYPPEGYHEHVEDITVKIAGGEHKTVQFKLKPVEDADLITGTVVDADGKAVAGASVRLIGTNEWEDTVRVTKADGKFRFTAPADERDLSLIAWLGDKAMSYPGKAEAGKQTALTLLDEGFGSITGQVKDEAGKPVRGARASWSWWPARDFDGGELLPAHAITDADGYFHFPRFWAGADHLSIFVSAKGFGTADERSVKITADHATDLSFVLKKANLSVHGIVVDSKGQPVPDVWVNYEGKGDAVRPAKTDADGKFHFDRLCAGNGSARAHLQTRGVSKSAIIRFKLPAQEELRIVLPDANATISGIVLDSHGKPAPNAKLRAGEPDREVKADDKGQFKITGITAGWHSVRIEFTGHDGIQIKHEARLKTGTANARIQLPAKTIVLPARPALPVDLIGKTAPPIDIAHWINTGPLGAAPAGKVRILDFWGLQCAPCIAALPHVRDFWQKHHGGKLEVISVTGFYPEQEVREFLAKHKDYQWPFALHSDDSTADSDYDIRGIPTYIVIDSEGIIRHNSHDWDQAAAEALKLLAK